MKTLYEYDKDDVGSLTLMDDGEISTSTYSYYISSWGSLNMPAYETRRLYEVLKEFYKEKV
jgi:hypothetical protein